MRIALISQAYPPMQGGGIATQTQLKAHGMAARGHEVHVITHRHALPPGGGLEGPVRLWTVPPVPADRDWVTEPERWRQHSGAVAAAIGELHARAPLDVVEFAEYGAEGYDYLREPGRVATVVQLHGPLVMLAHTIGWPEVDSDFYRECTRLEAACVQAADVVYSSSDCSRGWCARYYGLDPTGVETLHTGVDVELFRPGVCAPADRPTIVFVGKLVGNKGVGELTRAAVALAREVPGLRLRLIGPGDAGLTRHLHELAAAFPGLLETPGLVKRADLPAELCQAHVFAAPSFYEGGPGFVYLEAMACGLPVVAGAGSGASEVVRDGETGILVPPQDVAALTEALRRLLADAAGRTQLGRQARQYVETHADSRRCLDRLEALYVRAARWRR